MSLLIKNAEIPMHCAMCGFHGAMGDPMISQHFCKVTGVNILNPYKDRLNNCPLIPVPEPHGRLIDADALCEGRVSNDNVVIYAKCAPTIIPASEEG